MLFWQNIASPVTTCRSDRCAPTAPKHREFPYPCRVRRCGPAPFAPHAQRPTGNVAVFILLPRGALRPRRPHKNPTKTSANSDHRRYVWPFLSRKSGTCLNASINIGGLLPILRRRRITLFLTISYLPQASNRRAAANDSLCQFHHSS